MILLGLSLHEPNIFVIRESLHNVQCFRYKKKSCLRFGHTSAECENKPAKPTQKEIEKSCTLHVGEKIEFFFFLVFILKFPGNLPFGATEGDIRAAFGIYGEISEVRIILDRDTHKPKG